jgi:hypothetical protein
MSKRSFIKGVLVGAGTVIGLLVLLFFAMQYIYLYTENSNFAELRKKSELNCEKVPLHCLVRDENMEEITKYVNTTANLRPLVFEQVGSFFYDATCKPSDCALNGIQ